MKQFISRCLRKVIREVVRAAESSAPPSVTQANIVQIFQGEILKGKTVLITGGASGIGLAIAKKCLSEGATVVITGRSQEKLDSAKVMVNNPSLNILQWDISNISKISDKFADTLRLLAAPLDFLVNNAGILLKESGYPDVSESTWDQTYSVNSKGLFFLTQHVTKHWMQESTKGKVLNISSTGGFLAANNPYRMTKWDIVGFTQSLGIALSPYGIIVNGIAPGRTATEMLGVDPTANVFDSHQPVKRFGLPEEVAELALFLLSDASNYIIGQTIICDGGYTLRQ